MIKGPVAWSWQGEDEGKDPAYQAMTGSTLAPTKAAVEREGVARQLPVIARGTPRVPGAVEAKTALARTADAGKSCRDRSETASDCTGNIARTRSCRRRRVRCKEELAGRKKKKTQRRWLKRSASDCTGSTARRTSRTCQRRRNDDGERKLRRTAERMIARKSHTRSVDVLEAGRARSFTVQHRRHCESHCDNREHQNSQKHETFFLLLFFSAHAAPKKTRSKDKGDMLREHI